MLLTENKLRIRHGTFHPEILQELALENKDLSIKKMKTAVFPLYSEFMEYLYYERMLDSVKRILCMN